MEGNPPAMRDRTAMTEPLTIGQQLIARWEGVNSGWSEPADLAEAIDKAITEAHAAGKKEMCLEFVAWSNAMREARETKETEADE